MTLPPMCVYEVIRLKIDGNVILITYEVMFILILSHKNINNTHVKNTCSIILKDWNFRIFLSTLYFNYCLTFLFFTTFLLKKIQRQCKFWRLKTYLVAIIHENFSDTFFLPQFYNSISCQRIQWWNGHLKYDFRVHEISRKMGLEAS